MHGMFKIKYCHKIFDDKQIRNYCEKLFQQACGKYDIEISELGFDNNHVHMLVDIGLYSRPQVAKMLKGYTAKKLLQKFPKIKKQYFWNSGLWNTSYYLESPKDMKRIISYIRNQKYGKREDKKQMSLLNYAS
ncbi:IS200/IS605 family transposase [Candidatus Woesearchaeota archaeon]|nr:IS200/IS605 family transposase [Candidatus Woesearchaeota archaeon]HIH25688.1 IS200/IS605 family transposase [Nanoarchaeota archaeon]